MSNIELVLASASPARTKLLTDAGISHTVMVSDVDEDAVTAAHGEANAHDTALLLAQAKCEAVAAHYTGNGLVLGCDSVFEFEGTSYGKPYTEEAARERIRQMRGNSGVLHTGHWLIDTRPHDHADDSPAEDSNEDAGPAGSTSDGSSHDTPGVRMVGAGAVASATVHFADMNDQEIEAYIATSEPLNVAGSFTIDSYGGAFITRVEGDAHAIVGLSVSTLRSLLDRTGISITSFWP